MELNQEQQKKLKTSTRCLYLVIALLPLLVAATYTWFSLSQTPKVSEMGMSVDSGTGMELAFEPESEEWTQHLDFGRKLEDMAPLKPVTWSEKEQSFYAATFGTDGRIIGINEKLTDEANTNQKTTNGYYMKNTCYARSEEPVSVSLTPAVVGGDGTQGAGTYLIGTPIWDSDNVLHRNGGSGAEYAVRIGIRVNKFDKETNTRTGESYFYIYEPNCDGHFKDGQEVTDSTVVDTPSIDGTETLVPRERLIQQTTSTWTEKYPIEKNVVVRTLGEFKGETHLFDMQATEFAKIDIYVWLEGQDPDCTNAIGDKAQIFANIQFLAEVTNESGIEGF